MNHYERKVLWWCIDIRYGDKDFNVHFSVRKDHKAAPHHNLHQLYHS